MSNNKYQAMFDASVASGSPTDWFHDVYADAASGAGEVPWDSDAPNRWLQWWWEQYGQDLLDDGAKTLDVACGLGNNAEYLASQGLVVTAVDLVPKAIEMAKKRHGDSIVDYGVADMLSPPTALQSAFDFVSEVYTLQALPDAVRSQLRAGIASCVAVGGLLLVVCRYRPADVQADEHPPFALTLNEIEAVCDADGMTFEKITTDIDEQTQDDVTTRRLIGSFRRLS